MRYWGLMRTIVVGCALLAGLLSANPVVAALSLQTSFSVSQTYTDNLFFENNNTEEDFGTLFGPDLTFLFENPDIVIGATYTGRVSLFVNNSSANRYNQNVNIILDLPFLAKQYRGLTVQIIESMNFTPQLDAFSLSEAQNTNTSTLRGANPSIGGGGDSEGSPGGATGGLGGTGGTQGLFTKRASAFYNNAGLTLGYAWSPRLNPSLGYTNQYRHFFSGGFQDSLTHAVNFSVPYQVTAYTSVVPTYSYRLTDFLGKSTQNTSADQIISHNAQLGLTYAFTTTFSGTISGGVSFSKQKGATEQVPVTGGGVQERRIGSKFVGNGIGNASLTKTFQRGTLSLSANQTIGSGGGLASQSTRTRTVTGRGSYMFTPRMSGFASIGWAQNDSIDGNAFDAATYRLQTGLSNSFTRWLSGNLSYSRIDQRSKGTAASDVVVNQVFLGLTAVADPWFLVR